MIYYRCGIKTDTGEVGNWWVASHRELRKGQNILVIDRYTQAVYQTRVLDSAEHKEFTHRFEEYQEDLDDTAGFMKKPSTLDPSWIEKMWASYAVQESEMAKVFQNAAIYGKGYSYQEGPFIKATPTTKGETTMLTQKQKQDELERLEGRLEGLKSIEKEITQQKKEVNTAPIFEDTLTGQIIALEKEVAEGFSSILDKLENATGKEYSLRLFDAGTGNTIAKRG